MIIKNNNKAVDVLKNHHVCWEARKNSQRFYVKKTKTLIKTEYGSDPSTIPNISWEGGTTEKFNLYRKETYSVREGFTTRTEEQIYNYPNATFKRDSGDTSGCTINNTPNLNGPYTYNNPFSVTFSKRDNASSDRTIIICAMGFRGDIYEEANITITQTKREDDAPQTKPKPEIGDVLYSTANKKLTLDALTNGKNNTAIAICVIPEVLENFENGDNSDGAVKTARFVSLNYMNYDTPATGSKDPQSMFFGNYQVTIGNVKGGTDKTSYIGGKWNTQQCVSKATNQDKTSDKVDNNPGEGYCAPACCCERYSTPGTNPGDWYLPMPGELYQLYENKAAIDEKRNALVGSGFSESIGYWSSREYTSGSEYYVTLDNSGIDFSYKGNYRYVLGFLAVEVSQLVN